jgi:hypothetical protein
VDLESGTFDQSEGGAVDDHEAFLLERFASSPLYLTPGIDALNLAVLPTNSRYRVPRMLVDLTELALHKCTVEECFIATHIDGALSVVEIIEFSGLGETAAWAYIELLLRRNLAVLE